MPGGTEYIQKLAWNWKLGMNGIHLMLPVGSTWCPWPDVFPKGATKSVVLVILQQNPSH